MLGRFLFRWRGVIGVLAFGAVFWMARPTFGSCLFGIPFLVAGLAVRFWASGYIGIAGRVREIGMQSDEGGVRREEEGTPRRRIVTGPYRILRHPLYIGNFLLVVGMLVALWPASWLAVAVLVGFIVEYGVIVAAEEAKLAELGRNADCRMQNAKCRMADGEERMARGDGREAIGESFLLSRARCEWRTWVVTGVAWGLAMLRAAVSS